MAPEEIRDTLRHQPFEPFRLVMTDGGSYEIHHPDLLWVGQRSASVGLVGDAGKEFFERSATVDLLHVVRLEPIGSRTPST
jgi:hypothetical protein